MSSILDTTNPEPPISSPRANIESEFVQQESQDPQEEAIDLQQDDQSTATHPDLDFNVEEVEEVTQELLRRGTVYELSRSRSKPPPVEEKLLEEDEEPIIQMEERPIVEPKMRDLDIQMIMKESSVKKVEDFSIDSWKDLQGILKNNLIIAKNESKIEGRLLQKLEKRIKKNAKSKHDILERNKFIRNGKYDFDEKTAKRLVENQEEQLGEASHLIKALLNKLHDNPKIFALLSKNKENLKFLEETLTQSFYENNLEEDLTDNEIFKLFAELLKCELSDQMDKKVDSPSKAWGGRQDEFFSRLWAAYLNKPECKEYVKTVLQGPLLAFVKEKVEMNFDTKTIKEEIMKNKQVQQEAKRKLSQEVLLNPDNAEPSAELGIFSFVGKSPEQKVASFPEINEYQGIGIPIMKPKNSKIIIPEKEVPADNEAEEDQGDLRRRVSTLFEFAEYVYQSPLTRVKDEEVASVMRKRFQVLKHHLNILFQSIFDNLELMPMNIRILCRIIYDTIKQKFPSWPEKDCIRVLYNYLFTKWIIPHYIMPGTKGILDCYEETSETRNSLVTFAKVVEKVFTVNLYDTRDYMSELNEYIADIVQSIEVYYKELIAVNDDAIKEILEGKQAPSGDLKAKSICISPEEIQILCQVITKESKELTTAEYPQIIELAEKILELEEDRKTAEVESVKIKAKEESPEKNGKNKKERKMSGAEPEPPKQFLFSYVNLPVRPVSDYKGYFEHLLIFPKDASDEEKLMIRTKYSLKNFLMSIPRIGGIRKWDGAKNMSIMHILEKYSEKPFNCDPSETKKHDKMVSPQLSAQFLKTLLSKLPLDYKVNNFLKLYQEMYQDMKTHADAVLISISRTKFQLLEAIGILNEKNDLLAHTLVERDLTLKKMKIRNQIKTIELPLCISHPAAIKEVLKENIITDQNKLQSIQEFQDKIRIHSKPKPEDPCIHSRIHGLKDAGVGYAVLEKLKTYTLLGYLSQPESYKCFTEGLISHTKSIDEFVTYFSKLEEVKSMIETGQDIYEANEALIEVYGLAVQEIKKLYPHVSKHEEKFIKEEVENYICKRMYYHSFINFGYDKQVLKKDRDFWKLCTLHQWVNFDHLEIPEMAQAPEIWAFIAKELKRIDLQTTPTEKLDRATNCLLMVTQALELNANKKGLNGADDILPVMIYILLKANSQRMSSNLNYIKLMRDQQDMQESRGYGFIMLSSAFVVINAINPNFLGMTEEEYNEVFEKHRQKMIKLRKLSC